MSGKLAAWLGLVTIVAALGYFSRATGGGDPDEDALYKWSTSVSQIVLLAVIAGVVFLIALGEDRRDLFALRPPASWRRAALISLGVLAVVYGANAALTPFLDAGKEQGLTPSGWRPSRAPQYAVNFVVFGLLGPLVEELAFRGLGFRLLQRYGNAIAILGTGVAFGLWHGLIDALPVLVAFGIGLAYLRYRTNSIAPCVALHAVFNSLALVLAVTT